MLQTRRALTVCISNHFSYNTFSDVDYWVRNLDEHGAPGVQKVLVGNKIDLAHKRKVPSADAQALADKYGMLYFETSAKDDMNVEQCFFKLTKQISDRMQSSSGGHGVDIGKGGGSGSHRSHFSSIAR
jgi:Ras-related protein Rab-8A